MPFLLHDRLHLADHEIQAHVSGLLATYAGATVLFAPLAGLFADRSASRQLPFLSGLIFLLVGNTVFFVAQSLPIFYASRLLQDMSAAVVWTVGFTLCMDTVGKENLGKILGTIFSFLSVSALVAPVLGGSLYTKVGLWAVFALSSALLMGDFALRVLVIEKKVASKYMSEDTAPETLGNNEDNDIAAESVSASERDGTGEDQALLGESDNDYYRIPSDRPKWMAGVPILYCSRNPALMAARVLTFVQALMMGAFDSTVPTEGQALFGFTSLEAGLLFLPIALANIAAGLVVGFVVDRYGTRPAAVFGFTLLVPVLAAMRLMENPGAYQLVLYYVLLALSGAGIACISGPCIVEAATVVQKYHEANPDIFGERGAYAQNFALHTVVFNLGLTIGPVLAGALKDAVGYGNMNSVFAGLCAVSAFISYAFIGGTR